MAEMLQLGLTFIMWAFGAVVVGFFLILFGVVMYFAWRFMRYRIKVDIYEQVGKSFVGFGDLARELVNVLEDGKRKTYLQLLKGLKGKKRIPLPESANYIPFGMRKKLNLIYKDGLFSPLPIEEHSEPALTFNPMNLLSVLSSWDQDYSENLESYRVNPTFWDRYGNQFMWGFLIIMQFVLFLILIMQTQGGGGGGGLPSPIQMIS